MNDSISKVVTGIVGAGVVEVIPPISPEQIGVIGQIVIQLIIGVITIIQLFRKKKRRLS